MSDVHVEVAVIGAGLMGAATANELTRRRVSVALIEAHEPGHRHGSSHGSSRIVRRAYTDPFYLELTRRAFAAWDRTQDDLGVELIRYTGGVDHGSARDPAGLALLLAAHDVACELLSADEAAARWPGMRFDGPVLFHPQAGVLDADAAVAAWVGATQRRGGALVTGTRVRAVRSDGSGVLVETDGPAVAADRVVVAAGAWLPDLDLPADIGLPPLQITQQQVFHFAHRDPEAAWPTFVRKAETQLFGLPSGSDGGEASAYKVAEHSGGTPTTATDRDGVIDPASRERVVDYVRELLPGLDPDPVAEQSCLYTWTDDEDFVIDRVGPVVILSPCSGHGAKFAALVGELAADLALGRAEPEPRLASVTRGDVGPARH
jgi:monomeric sarcosine oxidase